MQIYGYDKMYNVDFRKNPDQLFGIFTTPENILRVKEWMKKAGFNPEQVYTFESFLKAVKMKSQEIDNNFKNSIKFESNLQLESSCVSISKQRKDREYEL